MSDLRIVRGNTFYTRAKITARDAATGNIVQGFSLNACEDLQFFAVRRGKSIEISSFSILDSTHIRIKWNGNEMKVGGYGLEGTGKYNGLEWRFYNTERYVFAIVESNEEANIPPSAFIETDYYQIEAEVSLVSALGGEQADWSQSDPSEPSYIRNKPDIPDESTVSEWGFTKNKGTYVMPVGGIPKADLAGAVQQSLSKADTALQSFTEADPTVPEWAKQESKPTYTASEVGAVPTSRTVNGKALSSDISLTASDVGAYTKPSGGIPASDLADGVIPDVSQFITKSVNDLANYYTKSQTYTQTEVQQLINAVKQFTYELVNTLPTASAPTMNKIYLTPSSDPQTQNVKDEYITIQNGSTYSWEQIGSTAIDLSGYVTTTALNNALADYITTADLNTLLAGYQTKIDATHKLDYSLLSNTPTKVSDFTNDSGFITTESDPTVPAWAKQPTKPSYTAQEVGALPSTTSIPSTLAELGDDTNHRTVSDAEKESWTLISGTNIKTLNGKSILGAGNLETAFPVVNHGTSDTTYTLPPNQLHIWVTVASLAITFGTSTDNTIVNEYMIEFTSGSTATTLSLPSSVEWAESCGALSVEASKTYQISIVNNIGLWAAISNS